ncbi:MAG: SDR family oxidoreductase [Flavisolibacter sp.]
MPTVLILGATSDIGFAIARKYASKGYDIQLTARNIESLKFFKTDLEQRFAVPCSCFLFEATDFKSHAAFYKNLFPIPDITVYVIGYMTENEIAFNNWDLALETIHANYTGAVSILNIVAEKYIQIKKGTIVGISSVAGIRGRQSNFIYGSAKAGFSAYLSGLRNRLYPHGVHVLTVLPGFVATKMTEHLSLPKILTAHPELVAETIVEAVDEKKDIIYIKWFWQWIMLIIMLIPESIFKKRKL